MTQHFFKILSTSVILLLFAAGTASAQDTTEETDTDASKTPDASTQTNDSDSTAEMLSELNQKMDAQQAQIEQLQRESAKQAEETEALKDELAYAAEERENLTLTLMEADNAVEEKKLNVFGFMDTSFTAAFPNQRHGEPNWESPIFLQTLRDSSFYQTNVNLYFKSEMSPTLEALVETRFTYQPNGTISEYPLTAYVGNIPTTRGEYVRTDTTVKNNYSGDFRLGGVAIERAQFDWKPRDWFKVRVGRFLTPFGIWHEDHGATVRITASSPFIISHNYLPNAQTGIMLWGKIFLGSHMDLEYAFTLSNGRGPFDEVYDLDQNKAMGLRNKLNVYAGDFSMSAGTYGYMGQYTDSVNELHVYMNQTGTGFSETEEQPVQWVETVTEKYDEIIIATDLQFHFKGFHLLGEYVRGKIEYIVPTPIYELTPLLIGSAPDEEAIEANRISQAWYQIFAYDLPLGKLSKNIRVTPFIGIDRLEPTDIYKTETVTLVQGGFNIKPSPFVVLKTNIYCIVPADKTLLGGNYWYWTNQVAVSF